MKQLPNIEFKPFRLGHIVATAGALELQEKGVDLSYFLRLHSTGDWGTLNEQDWDENNFSSKENFRIFSSYATEFGTLWIITEHDRSVTTFLRPNEY